MWQIVPVISTRLEGTALYAGLILAPAEQQEQEQDQEQEKDKEKEKEKEKEKLWKEQFY